MPHRSQPPVVRRSGGGRQAPGPRAGAGGQVHGRGYAGFGVPPRERHRVSGREAGEHPHQHLRRGQAHRLRACQGARRSLAGVGSCWVLGRNRLRP
ncbi:unnamed protein product [Effrenium voratum]|uniref:Uncharacterized protein n=1 Tax=Effrenium voratum TaxID=2562239 RepID=A0AA36JF46_9DINO|nr:unnamed protein product [Effrenium voratum]